MHRHRLVALALGLACTLLCACDSDTVRPKNVALPVYDDLTEKVHVLHNLELAVNQRDYAHYVDVLDPVDFVFFFATAGGGMPALWGYQEEIESAFKMFNKGGTHPILSIAVDLVDFETAQWVEFDPGDYPGWYATTVYYKLAVETEGETYVSPTAARAQFRVRQDDGDKWRLVYWHDYDRPAGAAAVSAAGVEGTSWGTLKLLFI
jgi:hypothetical protein